MKAVLKKDFGWCYDGITPTIIPAGTEVEGAVAVNALQMGLAEELGEEREEKAVEEVPQNKAAPAVQNKARSVPRRK